MDDLLQDIEDATKASPHCLDPSKRAALLTACDNLRDSIESPMEKTLRILMSPVDAIALRLAADMRLFDAASEAVVGKSEVQLDELATKTGADPLLIGRVMRMLSAMSVFRQISASSYAVTPLVQVYREGSPLSAAIVHMSSQERSIFNLPDYFDAKGFVSPTDAYDGPFQHAMKTDVHSFEWLAYQPRLQHAFNIVMATWRSQRGPRWFDVYSAAAELKVSDAPDALLVDVGGGIGHDVVGFKKRFPNVKGRLIVQDIPVVVADALHLPDGVEVMGHDFFAAQPVKDAGAYLLGNVLHDWPEKQAKLILGSLHKAMSKRSRLLIWENVMPEINASKLSAVMDLTMMAGLAGLERTLPQFEALLDQTGFKIVKTWVPEGSQINSGGQALIEATIKGD